MARKLKTFAIWILGAAAAGFGLSFLDKYVAPVFLDSRIERLYETGLPAARIENENTVYCRMKADDFRLALPPGSHAATPVITTGGIDWVDGRVEVSFGSSNQMNAAQYKGWLAEKLPAGASVKAEAIPGGLSIRFHYFGDK